MEYNRISSLDGDQSSSIHQPSESLPPFNPMTSSALWGAVRSEYRTLRLVPQRAYKPQTSGKVPLENLQSSVIFSTHDHYGFLVGDAVNQKYTHLIGRDDRDILHDCTTSITIRIEWPGYESRSYQVKAYDWCNPPNPITRSKLVTEIAKALQPIANGAINRRDSSIESDRWGLGPGGLNIDDVYIIGLERVSKGSWQPVFGVMA